MALDLTKVAIGGADVQIADWAANTGATGYVSVGILKDPPELAFSPENYMPEFESLPGAPVSFPNKDKGTLKVVMAECDLVKLQWILQQPTANLSGTDPNRTLLIGDRTEQYKSIKIITKGITGSGGTRATRTVSVYRVAAVGKIDPVTFGKSKEQLFSVTFDVLYDTTVTTNDRWAKIVDTGAA